MNKSLILIPGLFVFSLLQTSIFPSLRFLNIYLILVFVIIFFTQDLLLAFLSGLFLDIFSFSFFGMFALVLFISAFVVKKSSIMFKGTNLISFIILFLIFLVSYNILFYLFSYV